MHSGHSCGAKSTVARDTGLITPGKKNIYILPQTPSKRSHWGPLPENHYQRRRLRWLGHVMRLEDDTPARIPKTCKETKGTPHHYMAEENIKRSE